MNMDVNSFTHRAGEALAVAQREARARDHQRIEPEHLLVALLADADWVVYPIVRRAGADPGMLKSRAAEARPDPQGLRARAGDGCLAPAGPADRAGPQGGRRPRRPVRPSTEHLLLALTEGSTAAARLLTEAGVTREAILARSPRSAGAGRSPTRTRRPSTRRWSASAAT